MDVGEETQKEIDNETETIPTSSSEELLNKEVTVAEDKTFNIDTNVKIDMAVKIMPDEPEANSLDEQLIYSDAEGDVDDKDLLDEIDATDISNDKLEQPEIPISSDLLTSQKDEMDATDNSNDKLEHIETPIPSHHLTSQKDDKETAKKDEINMEVDADLSITQMTQKSDLNDTNSSATDMNTSSYDIKIDHGLDRPDVMIDIPTQELIDTFDDADETFDNTEGKEDDQTVSNIIDKLDIIETNVNKLSTDEKQTSTAGTESMDIDNDTEVTEKLELETALETKKPDEVNVTTLEEKVTHADIILEANSELTKVQEEASFIDKGKSNQEDKESSKNLELKNVEETVTKDVDKTQPSTKDVEDTVTKDVDEAQPSTSKYHQESSDEDQEATDSLGLLAESSRVMDDEDDQEQEAEPEDDDDDEDFDQDDESNQMTAEHSEDSSAQQSEADVPKETMEVDESNDGQAEESTDIADLDTQDDLPEMDTQDELPDAAETPDEPDDESSDELGIQIEQVLSQNEVEDTIVAPETLGATDEALKAVEVLLEDGKVIENTEVPQVLTITAEKETVKPAESDSGSAASSKLRQLLLRDGEPSAALSEEKKSPSKTKKLEISKPRNEINIVELEESSSEDDIQVVKQADTPASPKDVTSVTIPSEIEVMATAAGETSDIQERDGEVRVSGLPKPQPHKPTRLNTDEISIKTASTSEPLVIPETTPASKAAEATASIDFTLEIFSLDSDDEETEVRSKRKSKLTAVELDKARQTNKCINMNCTSDGSVPLVPASVSAAIYYAANQQRGVGLCLYCAKRFEERSECLRIGSVLASYNQTKCINMNCTSDGSVPLVPASVSAAIYYAANQQRGVGLCLYCAKRFEERSECFRVGSVLASYNQTKCINMNCTSDGSVPLVPASVSAAIYYAANQQRGVGLCLYCAKRFEERSECLRVGSVLVSYNQIKCINMNCTSDGSVPLVPASVSSAIYYAANQQRGVGLCLYCAKRFEERSEKLVEGVKGSTPFLSMDMCLIREEFVEISDSDSDDEPDIEKNDSEIIGEKGAKFLEEQLADMFNETWKKFNMEERLLSAQTEINIEVSQLEGDMFNETWKKFNMEDRLLSAETEIIIEVSQLEGLGDMFKETWKKFNMEDRLLSAETKINIEVSQLEGDMFNETWKKFNMEDRLLSAETEIIIEVSQLEGLGDMFKETWKKFNMEDRLLSAETKINIEVSQLEGDMFNETWKKFNMEERLLSAQTEINIEVSQLEGLADMFNETWKKFNMEDRLLSAQTEINIEVSQLEEECKEIDAMLNECQRETDKLRNDLYAKFADDRTELPPIAIIDTPTNQWSGLEDGVTSPPPVPETRERPKRRSAAAAEPPAKRAAIPLGYAPLDGASTSKPMEAKPVPSADLAAQNDDDNADISVVKLSVESAPAGLPPPGVAARAPLRPSMLVYAMKNSFGAWHKVRVQEVQPKTPGQFTMCRVRFEQPKTMTKLLPARCLAYEQPPEVRLTIGTRVVALFKDHRLSVEKREDGEKKEAYYSGIVAEIPNPVNNFRYLIFFDDGYAQYVQHANTRLVCECAPRVWDEVHPFSRNFVRDYLRAYPERPMVRLHAGQSIKTEWDGKWWVSKVLQVDASLVLVYFEGKKDNKTEWIYRGSTRLAPLYLELQAAERTRARPLPRAQAARRFNMPYVEYTRSDEDKTAATPQEIRRQRAVAKKSTALPPTPAPPTPVARDNVTSRVVFYTPKNAIKPHKMAPHTCGPRCRRTDVLALKDLRTYNPLTKPLLSGWERQTVRYRIPATKAVMYRAPCGRRIRNYDELHRYLQAINSDMGVDLFDFNPTTHCLAEFLLNKCLISKKDLSHGKENVPVPCVNYYDSSLPEFCSYNTERTPTAGVPLNLDPEFLCGCDCTDDCADKSKCACWKMTLEGARTIGLDTTEVGYVYKRLPEPLPSGIYECNSRCKCKQTCLNRVAQHPLQLKLQVFKTANRGWGIRALNDVPKGAFLCVYAGNLLTDATANLDGLNEGDEYLAELDYIEVVEQMKEGFEEDIPEDAKKADEDENESSSMSSSSEEEPEKQDGDDDFRPAMPARQYTPSEYSKRLRKREKSKKVKEEREKKQKDKDGNEDCITISDDEELREPAHFSAQAGMGGKGFISKYKSVRTLFGKDEACYIMDAKVQGNIGRYLNHSCTPNVFVQNVFVDTHDPRFPWVAFFALSQIRAGTELTWNYNYDVGSVPGKVLYCYCNAPNCRGRLL
ncbi:uncharacterized protein LOC134660417 [Cydia amplana]|uniref:uncharacterized protein LOC134660417 n=1 Tax=Cydia amplana TaxID=1869771 RepID=UPI002FE6960A